MNQNDKRLVVVLGMHRSGTSVITRALQVLDVELGDKFVPSQDDNITGYWEDIDLNALNIDMINFLKSDWHFLTPIQLSDVDALRKNGYVFRAVELLEKKTSGVRIFGFKDPRTAKLLPFWKEVFAHSKLNVSYVLAIRHPFSVSRSLAERNGFDSEKSCLLWLVHVIGSLVGTVGEHCIVVDYDCLIQSPDKELKRVANELQLKIDTHKLEKFNSVFLNKELRHTVYQLNDLAHDCLIPPLVREVYLEVFNVATDKVKLNDATFKDKIKQWNNEFLRQKPTLILADKLSLKLISTEQTLAQKEQKIKALYTQLAEKEQTLNLILNSNSWRLVTAIHKIQTWLVPKDGHCEHLMKKVLPGIKKNRK